MLIDTAAWVEAGGWLAAERPAREAPISEFAARTLKTRAKRIRKEGASIAELEPQARHALRIAVKKLRYAVEFFETAFDAGELKPKARARRHGAMRAHLEALQEDLGALNDLVVGETMAAGFHDPDPALARGLAKLARPDGEAAGETAAAHLAAAKKAHKRFSKAKPFWG